MTKNTTGGSMHKKVSRKGSNSTNVSWDLNDPAIIQVSVSKALGFNKFYVLTKDNRRLICTIPKKFSGRNKHRNFVVVSQIILVALREYENPQNNCDFLQIVQATTPNTFFHAGVLDKKIVDTDDLDHLFNNNDETNELNTIIEDEETNHNHNPAFTTEMDFDLI